MNHVVANHLVGHGYAVSDKTVRFDRWILAAERRSLRTPEGEEVRLSPANCGCSKRFSNGLTKS
jgi:hypothetical protein